MKQVVLVTGANGFVGLNICRELIDHNYDVIALVRSGSNVNYLSTMPVTQRLWPKIEANALASILDGVDYLIHCAGNTSCNPADYPALQQSNVDTTAALLKAAHMAGVRRIVYTSTTSTIGSCHSGRFDELSPSRGFRKSSPYARTKAQAEQLLLNQSDVPAVVLNPAEILGPYDHNLQWGRIVLALAHGELPFIPPGGGSFCHAESVAKAHVSALVRGRAGERYILAGYDLKFADLFAQMADILDVPLKVINQNPYWLQRLDASFRQRFSRFDPPAVDAYRMRVFANEFYFYDRKARQELNYESLPPARMISDCYRWYKQEGFIHRKEKPLVAVASDGVH